jgi:uncharacterized protein
MAVRFPTLPGRSLGVGLDLPWDGRSGFGYDPGRGDRLTAPARQFLQTYAPSFSHAFFSWQPRDRGPARIEDYASPWDDLWETLPEGLPCALHHTALNLGALGHYRRDAIFAFTNALCARYRLQWINEDVGLWSLAGRPVPYPLPPLLNDEGLRATIENVTECQAALVAPLVLEFPGFSRGVSVVLGDQHAYDFFRVLAEETESPVTLDVGHLLSYQWWRGLRGAALFDDLSRLPLQHCFELHLSGSAIVEDRFIDAHHGVLLEEQLVLLDRLLPLCPALRAVTFEDPRFDPQGRILPSSERSWRLLAERTASWRTQRPTALAATD